MIGANGPYLHQGTFLFHTSIRYLDSSRHFSGTKEQTVRRDFANQVHNEQRILDLGFTYALTDRTSMSLSVPWLMYGSWSIPLPIGPPFQPTETKGPRFKQTAEGLGDVVLSARRWMLDPAAHEHANVQFGFGVKAPTGESNYKQAFPDFGGEKILERSVDQSIQPGDGGWGAVADFQTFYDAEWCTLFANGTYLANPRNVNSTLSIGSNLRGAANVDQDVVFNSVPDQYLFRAGLAREVDPVPGLVGYLAWRVEGVPARDLIGDENGFRRPGYATFLEPGVSYTHENSTWSLSFPWTLQQNRVNNHRDVPGDATFADWILILGWTVAF